VKELLRAVKGFFLPRTVELLLPLVHQQQHQNGTVAQANFGAWRAGRASAAPRDGQLVLKRVPRRVAGAHDRGHRANRLAGAPRRGGRRTYSHMGSP
jgi:hypothetical protein